MGRDRDADHEVSGREGDRDANFTQPSRRRGVSYRTRARKYDTQSNTIRVHTPIW